MRVHQLLMRLGWALSLLACASTTQVQTVVARNDVSNPREFIGLGFKLQAPQKLVLDDHKVIADFDTYSFRSAVDDLVLEWSAYVGNHPSFPSYAPADAVTSVLTVAGATAPTKHWMHDGMHNQETLVSLGHEFPAFVHVFFRAKGPSALEVASAILQSIEPVGGKNVVARPPPVADRTAACQLECTVGTECVRYISLDGWREGCYRVCTTNGECDAGELCTCPNEPPRSRDCMPVSEIPRGVCVPSP